MAWKKKIIRSSNLALRFYLKDGWTKEELMEISPEGLPDMPFPTDGDPYFVFTKAGQVNNVDKLLESCLKLYRQYDDRPEQSDREFMLQHL